MLICSTLPGCLCSELSTTRHLGPQERFAACQTAWMDKLPVIDAPAMSPGPPWRSPADSLCALWPDEWAGWLEALESKHPPQKQPSAIAGWALGDKYPNSLIPQVGGTTQVGGATQVGGGNTLSQRSQQECALVAHSGNPLLNASSMALPSLTSLLPILLPVSPANQSACLQVLSLGPAFRGTQNECA